MLRKLIRFYNRNVKKIWTVIIVLVFLFSVRNILNDFYKNRNAEIAKRNQNKVVKQDNYEKHSESLVSGKKVSENYQDKFGKLIDEFLKHCINHEPESAYTLLSNDCKSVFYQTEEIFQKKYYEKRFKGDKKYNFQSWTSDNEYVYLVKVFDNMLTTGKSSEKGYIEDYITVVKEGEEYRLNVNAFINKKIRDKKVSISEGISIKVKNSFIFMDYEIAEFEIINKSNNELVVDSKERTDSIYLLDDTNIKFEALTYENEESEFKVYPNEKKKIKIKYTNPYRDNKSVKKFIFDDVRVNGEVKKIEIEI